MPIELERMSLEVLLLPANTATLLSGRMRSTWRQQQVHVGRGRVCLPTLSLCGTCAERYLNSVLIFCVQRSLHCRDYSLKIQ